jgi:hypothetical protein
LSTAAQHPDHPAITVADGPDSHGPYTGVIVIHGLGDIQRNAILQQALNALSYWFNHVAGLALRPEGPGRVWLTTQLTDDVSPDAPASRATMVLTPPSTTAGALDGEAPLRLEFREVWWAESHGSPSVASTIRWARFQFGQEAARLLLPLGRRAGPARAAARAPAREVSQALTYRPTADGGKSTTGMGAAGTGSDGGQPPLSRPTRALLRGLLYLYGLFQYVWKAVQWLLLTPAITLLLLVMGLVRLLAIFPPLQSAAVQSFNAITEKVMLRWVSSMQSYLLDYTRSAGMRGRFEHEVTEFLRDERCERIVVISHSWGTVIGYEGLTTALAQSEVAHSQKPVTFICLAAALRRAWLLDEADPHRLHGVLPERVRWLHFWARYDPVAAGPLIPRSLPPLAWWPDGVDPNPYRALVSGLERCENIDVVNTDGTFTDHNTYWDNLEQVVGPIARELVAGHPALDQVVQAHLATPDDVLRRRWRIAWRATATILGGLVAGAAIVTLDVKTGAGVGHWVQTHLSPLVGGIVQQFCNLPACQDLANGRAPSLNPRDLINLLTGNGIFVPLLLITVGATPFFSELAVLAVMFGAMTGISRAIAAPSPFAFRTTSPSSRGDAKLSVFALAMVALMLVGAAKFLDSDYFHPHQPLHGKALQAFAYTYLTVAGLAQLVGAVAFAVALFVAIQHRQWGWAVAFPLAWMVAFGGDQLASTAFVVVAVAGWLAASVALIRARDWGWLVAMLILVLPLLYAAVGPVIYSLADFSPQHASSTPFFLASFQGESAAAYLPLLAYGLWMGPLQFNAWRISSRYVQGALALTLLFFLPYAVQGLTKFLTIVPHNAEDLAQSLAPVMVATGIIALGLCLVDAIRGRRWNWVAGIPLVLLGFIELSTALYVGQPSSLQSFTLPPATVSLSLFTATLIYALWSGPVRPQRVPAADVKA